MIKNIIKKKNDINYTNKNNINDIKKTKRKKRKKKMNNDNKKNINKQEDNQLPENTYPYREEKQNKKRGFKGSLISYIALALVASIIGGLASTYLAPKLFGSVLDDPGPNK